MSDIVVTVPKTFKWGGSANRGLRAWADEGDCAGQPFTVADGARLGRPWGH